MTTGPRTDKLPSGILLIFPEEPTTERIKDETATAALELIIKLGPAIVFIDEIDQTRWPGMYYPNYKEVSDGATK